eukprot:6190603-Pleurochrysis_carterae.AAC.1
MEGCQEAGYQEAVSTATFMYCMLQALMCIHARVLEQIPKSIHAPDVHFSVFMTASTPSKMS